MMGLGEEFGEIIGDIFGDLGEKTQTPVKSIS